MVAPAFGVVPSSNRLPDSRIRLPASPVAGPVRVSVADRDSTRTVTVPLLPRCPASPAQVAVYHTEPASGGRSVTVNLPSASVLTAGSVVLVPSGPVRT